MFFRVALLLTTILAAGTAQTQTLTLCPFASTPLEPCCGFFGLGFELLKFDQYETYFSDTSTFTLAQAGVYTGPKAISEYVQFATPLSPYVAGSNLEERRTDFGGFDGTTCTFTDYRLTKFAFEKKIIGDDTIFHVVSLFKIEYDVNANKISKVSLFITQEYISFFFDTTSSRKVNKFICDKMKNTCDLSIGNEKSCIKRLDSLPVAQNGYIDGNTQGCRVLHSVLALSDPEMHCPHINFENTADPNGKFKCFESSNINPSDLFDDAEIATFADFCKSQGIDPEIGYTILPPPKKTKSPKAKSAAPKAGRLKVNKK